MRARVSGVILAAVVISGVIVCLLTDGGVGLFARKVDMKTYLPDATGLSVNAPVRLNGIQVGAVKSIAISQYLDRQRAVRVDLRVESSYLPKIPSDSMTSIGSDTLIGDKFLDIAAGKNKEMAGDGSELRSEPEESAADKADLIYGLQDSLKKLDAMVAQVASPDTPVGHYIVGQQEYDQALRSIAIFEGQMRGLVSKSNPAGEAVFTTNMYTRIRQPVLQIDNMLQAIQRGEGAAGHLYASDEQYNRILDSLRDLRKTIAQFRADMEKSGAGPDDGATYRNVQRMLASTDAMLASLNRGEGAAGDLLSNPQLYESLVGALTSIQDMVHDFDANPKKYLRTKLF